MANDPIVPATHLRAHMAGHMVPRGAGRVLTYEGVCAAANEIERHYDKRLRRLGYNVDAQEVSRDDLVNLVREALDTATGTNRAIAERLVLLFEGCRIVKDTTS